MKIDWKRKLSSRKFWALIAGFVTGLIIYINSPEKSPEAIGGLIITLGSIVSYIIGEGLADSKDTYTTYPCQELTYDPKEEQENGISST